MLVLIFVESDLGVVELPGLSPLGYCLVLFEDVFQKFFSVLAVICSHEIEVSFW